MKLLIIANSPVFDGRKREYVEITNKKKPINRSRKNWRIEEYYDKGYWSLCREVDKDKVAEFRFRAMGRLKTIEELKGFVWLKDEKCEEFLFSAIEMEIVNL